jgi:short-subunit dehydrogenase
MAEKLCVVVGVGPGLGMGIARKFAQGGYRIALLSRSAEKQKVYLKELTDLGVQARGFSGDVMDDASIGRAFAEIRHAMGPIEVMSYSPQPPLVADLRDWMPLTMPWDELGRCMKICCYAAVNCVNQVVGEMIARRTGTILITTSGSGISPIKTLTPIGMSMAAARNYAICLNQTLSDKGVYAGNVTLSLLVEPGDPYGDPNTIAQAHWDLHTKRDRPEINVTSPVDPHEHHVKDMQRFGREIPQD